MNRQMSKKGMSPKRAQELKKEKGIEETKLQTVRVEKGYSQSKLSIKSGVNARMIQGYEQRRRLIENAKLETICDLALALDCKITDILDDKQLIDKLRLTR